MDICLLLNAQSPSPGLATTATAAAAANDPTDDEYTGATIPQLPPSPLLDSYDDLFAYGGQGGEDVSARSELVALDTLAKSLA
ncbi:hypothetical protein MGU_09416 [Metarhizium guizhouense ARSEF 977]|uniref:Uncharacterized protein n=1 Tax=Metarhizium guizhouense (strain ARSEF 977) TaxID=1276136 RepID=A0A0B4G9A5_METGA|nr:hypothetical protein MGU_09416 [Metarhizium guizhouense ARSEF 977]